MGDHVDVIEYLLEAVRLFIFLIIYTKFLIIREQILMHEIHQNEHHF